MAKDPYSVMPCPDCGNDRLIQHRTQTEEVYVDENGEPEHYKPRGPGEVQEMWCPECDEKIWEIEE